MVITPLNVYIGSKQYIPRVTASARFLFGWWSVEKGETQIHRRNLADSSVKWSRLRHQNAGVVGSNPAQEGKPLI